MTNAAPNVEVLPTDWVESKFNEVFRNDLIHSSTIQQINKVARVPPGGPRTDSNIPRSLVRIDSPTITYMQGSLHTCVTDSVANVFMYLGKTKQGSTMHSFGLDRCSAGNTAALNMLGAAREKIVSLEPNWRVHVFRETKI